EGVYSASNLGIVELQQAKYPDAAETFRTSVAAMDRLTANQPNNVEYLQLMQNALAYYADALDRNGQIDLAIAQRQRQLDIAAPYLAQPRPDAWLRAKAMIAHRALSRLLFERGDTAVALDQAAAAVADGQRLVELEPTNAEWLVGNANSQI